MGAKIHDRDSIFESAPAMTAEYSNWVRMNSKFDLFTFTAAKNWPLHSNRPSTAVDLHLDKQQEFNYHTCNAERPEIRILAVNVA